MPSSSIALRRPILIPWSSYIEDSIKILSSSPSAVPSDQYLAHLVRIDHIVEDTAALYQMEDPNQSRSLTSMTIQYHMKGCEGLLRSWLDHAMMGDWHVPKGMMSNIIDTKRLFTEPTGKALMQYLEAVTNLYVHEIAMHNAHNADDYKLQTSLQIKAQATFEDKGPDQITPIHIEALG